MKGYYTDNNTSSRKILSVSLIGILAVTAAVLAYSSSSSQSSSVLLISKNQIEDIEFTLYMKDFNKVYKNEEELKARHTAFRDNLGYIRVHNSKGASWILGTNQFTDMTNAEFKSMYARSKYLVPEIDIEPITATYPQTVNWVTKGGVVTPVKDQGQCGSCWAFSTTGATEGAWALAGHPLVSLSEQQLVDCDDSNYGCNGGWPILAYQYIIANKGINSEANYPYLAYTNYCNYAAQSQSVATLHSYTSVAQNNIDALATAAAQQPVSVLVEADGPDWQSYKGGIVTDKNCGTSLDHAVLVVGYDMTNNPPYWLIKNSWSTSWGQAGYIQLAIVAGNGICGVQMSPTYPIV